jgi:hypothetical protein
MALTSSCESGVARRQRVVECEMVGSVADGARLRNAKASSGRAIPAAIAPSTSTSGSASARAPSTARRSRTRARTRACGANPCGPIGRRPGRVAARYGRRTRGSGRGSRSCSNYDSNGVVVAQGPCRPAARYTRSAPARGRTRRRVRRGPMRTKRLRERSGSWCVPPSGWTGGTGISRRDRSRLRVKKRKLSGRFETVARTSDAR